MTQTSTAGEKIKHEAKKASKKVAESRWVVWVARFGYASKGVVYIVVGALATLAATGLGGEATDARGALQSIARQPFGKILLGVVSAGLVGYVLWRWVQAITDADDKGSDAKGLSLRVGYFFSGVVYAGLAFTALQILLYARRANGNAPRDWTVWLMSLPFGQWIVGLIGAGVVGYGLYQIYKGYKAKFRRRLKRGEMGEARHDWMTLTGRIGYAARGVVFCVVGAFLVQAALHFEPNEVKGLDGALQALAQESFGPWVLGLVAVGLVAYGFYMLVEARYRIIAGG
jgi:hypothetical protein